MVFVDIDPEHEAALAEWYETVHLPDILACPGWLDARRETCLEGGPRLVAIYTITGPEAYETPRIPSYQGLRTLCGQGAQLPSHPPDPQLSRKDGYRQMLNLRQLEILRAVVQYRTTVGAAEQLGMSQPSISTPSGISKPCWAFRCSNASRTG